MLVFLETGSFLDINQEKAIVYLTQKARKARKYSMRCDLSPTEIAETI